ncbi:MAG TPA: hypothetical protein DCR14_10605 [Acidimicrobiaceae bacterium]|nr:hypothetical protein [Acidimicrobiaceae bacterium]
MRTVKRAAKIGGVVLAVLVALAVIGNLLIDDTEDVVKLYDRAPVPAVPSRTEPVPADGALPDGSYWVETIEAVDGGLQLTVMQAFFGPACVEELGDDECPNDYGVVAAPTAVLPVAATDTVSITVVADTRQNYAVFPDELVRLAGGQPPAAEAPDTYTYVPYPFLATVRDGAVVELRQIWVP